MKNSKPKKTTTKEEQVDLLNCAEACKAIGDVALEYANGDPRKAQFLLETTAMLHERVAASEGIQTDSETLTKLRKLGSCFKCGARNVYTKTDGTVVCRSCGHREPPGGLIYTPADIKV